jgi:hypothetical protein
MYQLSLRDRYLSSQPPANIVTSIDSNTML